MVLRKNTLSALSCLPRLIALGGAIYQVMVPETLWLASRA